MAQTPEAKVKQKIKRYLNKIGAYSCSPIGSAFGTHGVPDILVCYRGRFIGIEVKAPGKLKNVTENQARHIQAIRDAGGRAVVADDVQIVVDLFESLD